MLRFTSRWGTCALFYRLCLVDISSLGPRRSYSASYPRWCTNYRPNHPEMACLVRLGRFLTEILEQVGAPSICRRVASGFFFQYHESSLDAEIWTAYQSAAGKSANIVSDPARRPGGAVRPRPRRTPTPARLAVRAARSRLEACGGPGVAGVDGRTR